MTSSRAVWLSVMCLNAFWLWRFDDTAAKAIALIGMIIAAAALVVPLVMARAGDYVRDGQPAPSRAATAAALVPFALPVLSLIGIPRLAFWTLDGGAWLILAWLWLSMVLSSWRRRAPEDHGWRLPLATMLFLIWSSALWLTAVGDLGGDAFIVNSDRTVYRECQADPLTVAFTIWETRPASDHLFLGWRYFQEFEQRRPYANHVHPFLFTMYAWVTGVRAMTGVALHTASNTTPFLHMLVLLAGMTTLLARLGLLRNRHGFVDLVLLFVACGMVATGWRFWFDLYRYSSDSPYPLLAGIFVFVYAFLLEPVRPVLAVISGASLAAMSPIHTPMLIAAIAFMFGRPRTTGESFVRRNRVVLAVSVAALAAGVVAYSLPRMLIAWKGYTPTASTFMFRSGLDGDTQYFSNMAQAVISSCGVSCCGARPVTALLFPALVPLLVFAAWAWKSSAGGGGRLWHLLLFLCSPYVMSVVLFPQSVSIHPHYYDHLLIVPVTIAGVVAMLNPALRAHLQGGPLFAVLLLSGGVLMSNLIAIAQGFARMPK